jgi:multicomponent Na+:H+ antiporter subunit D
LVALSLAIGVAAQPMLALVQTAASQAIDRAGYVRTVNPELTEQDRSLPLGIQSQRSEKAGG